MSGFYQHRACKCLGQNSLYDAGVIYRILRAIHAREGQCLLEIDPDQSTLTEELLGSGVRLDVAELDRDLISLSKLKFGLESCFSLYQGDALKFDFASLVESGEKLRVAGNLPYNIFMPLIFHLLEHVSAIEGIHFILQKEVVECLMATSGGGDWGRLSIMVQYHCRVKYLFNVGPDALNPPPKVDSATVCPTPFTEPSHPARDPKLLERVVRETFNQRRETLRNILKLLLSVEDIETAEVDPILRPEQLDLAVFVRLANRLAEPPGNR